MLGNMEQKKLKNKEELTIRDLYPDLSEEELKIAEENLERYLELVVRIFKRIEAEKKSRPPDFDG